MSEEKPVTNANISRIGNGFIVEWYNPKGYGWEKQFRETYQQAREFVDSLFEPKGE